MATKMKIPKRVAGVRVPKKLRRKAKEAVALAESPAVRELAVAALGAAAAKIAESAKARQAARAAKESTGEAAETAKAASGEAGRQALKLADVIRAAALEGARRLLDEIDRVEGETEPKSSGEPRQGAEAKKKEAKEAKA